MNLETNRDWEKQPWARKDAEASQTLAWVAKSLQEKSPALDDIFCDNFLSDLERIINATKKSPFLSEEDVAEIFSQIVSLTSQVKDRETAAKALTRVVGLAEEKEQVTYDKLWKHTRRSVGCAYPTHDIYDRQPKH